VIVNRNSVVFARSLLATNLKAALALRGAFVMQVAFMALNNLTFFVFWWALMARVPVIRGWRLADVELLFGLVAAAVGLTVAFAGGLRHLGRFIEDGDLDTLLTQPRSVLVYALGMRSHPSGIGDMMSGAFLIAASGYVSWRSMPLVIVAIGASAAIFVASGVLFFSLAFWLDKVESIARQMWELLITFSLYPEPLFGGVLRVALFTILPAGFVGYLPVAVVRSPSLPEVCLLFGGAAAYLALAVLVFNRGLRRYASGSRFSTFG
jgi:ABC-2 type transport system permease protein